MKILGQGQCLQTGGPDRPETILSVGQAEPVSRVDDLREEVVSPQPYEHRPCAGELVAAPSHAAPDHHVGIAGHDRRGESGDVSRIVRSVCIHGHDDVTRCGRNADTERITFAAAAILNHAEALGRQLIGGSVSAVAVDDDEIVAVGPDRARKVDNRLAFIASRDDDGDRHRSAYL